jgi:predicted dehydrogenase
MPKSSADELIALAQNTGKVLTVGHQERFVFARTGLLEFSDAPKEISCWRLGPWTGRGADVSVVLDLMIHDLDLVHRLVPGSVSAVSARARTVHSRHPDEVTAQLDFAQGTRVRLDVSRVASARSRGMRVTYEDGQIEIDFMTRKVRNTTSQALRPLDFDDPLGASVAAFAGAARGEADALVRPEEARDALETALIVGDAAERSFDVEAARAYEPIAAAR